MLCPFSPKVPSSLSLSLLKTTASLEKQMSRYRISTSNSNYSISNFKHLKLLTMLITRLQEWAASTEIFGEVIRRITWQTRFTSVNTLHLHAQREWSDVDLKRAISTNIWLNSVGTKKKKKIPQSTIFNICINLKLVFETQQQPSPPAVWCLFDFKQCCLCSPEHLR